MVYNRRLDFNVVRIDTMMDDITLALLGFMVCFAIALVIYGIQSDRYKKIKEVKLMIQPAKQYVRCISCKAWTSLASSNAFEGIGILCIKCTQAILALKKEVATPAKKRSGFMSFIRGSQDEY
jgi:hypothetical protein